MDKLQDGLDRAQICLAKAHDPRRGSAMRLTLKDQGYGRFHLLQAFAVLGRFSQRAEAMIPRSSAMIDITWVSGVQDI